MFGLNGLCFECAWTEYSESYSRNVDHIPCNSHQTAPGALVRDLYFVHHLQLAAVIPQSLPFLLKKKKRGRVRFGYWGSERESLGLSAIPCPTTNYVDHSLRLLSLTQQVIYFLKAECVWFLTSWILQFQMHVNLVLLTQQMIILGMLPFSTVE